MTSQFLDLARCKVRKVFKHTTITLLRRTISGPSLLSANTKRVSLLSSPRSLTLYTLLWIRSATTSTQKVDDLEKTSAVVSHKDTTKQFKVTNSKDKKQPTTPSSGVAHFKGSFSSSGKKNEIDRVWSNVVKVLVEGNAIAFGPAELTFDQKSSEMEFSTKPRDDVWDKADRPRESLKECLQGHQEDGQHGNDSDRRQFGSFDEFQKQALLGAHVNRFEKRLEHQNPQRRYPRNEAVVWRRPSLGRRHEFTCIPQTISWQLVHNEANMAKRLFQTCSERGVSKSQSSQSLSSFNTLFSVEGIEDRVVPIQEIIQDLQTIQNVLHPTSARPYRYAKVKLASLSDKEEGVTVCDLKRVLTPTDNIAWRVVSSRVLNGVPDKTVLNLTEEEKALAEFMRIINVGQTKAKKIYEAGYRSLEELIQDLNNAPLEKASKIGLSHLRDIETRIAREEAAVWDSYIHDLLSQIDSRFQVELVGSYRRGRATCNDLDFIISHPDISREVDKKQEMCGKEILQNVIDKLLHDGVLVDEPLAQGVYLFRGLVKGNDQVWRKLGRKQEESSNKFRVRRIDLFLTSEASWPFMLLAKSGDTSLMQFLRSKAKARGLALNEFGIGPRNDNGSAAKRFALEATSEKDIFDYLGVPYLEPTFRDAVNWSETIEFE